MNGVRVAGAVLTGGSSTRMGSDKATFLVDGEPMAASVARVLRSVGCSPVVLVGGDSATLAALGERVIVDRAPGAGPAGGVVTAIDALRDMADAVLVVSCDLAFLTVDQVQPLIDALDADAGARDVDVAVARTDRPQPLCALWRTDVFNAVQEAFDSGVRSVFGLLDLLRVAEIAVSAGGMRNINSPADLRAGPAQH